MKINNTIQLDSVECIVPIETVPQVKLRGKPDSQQKASQVLKITLSDCVQCSGCITSAEEVFITQSNSNMLLDLITNNQCQLIISQSSFLTLKYVVTHTYDLSNQLFLNFLSSTLQQEVILEDLSPSFGTYCQIISNHLQQQNQQAMIITDCPAVKMYLFKRAPHLQKYLFNVKTSHEYTSRQFLECQKTRITVTACNDRKLEALRSGISCFTASDFGKVLFQLPSYQNNLNILLADVFAGNDQNFTVFEPNLNLQGDVTVVQQTRDQQVYKKKELELNSVYFVMACPRGCYGGSNLVATSDLSQETKNAREFALSHLQMKFASIYPSEDSLVINQVQMSPEQIATSKGVSGIRIQDLQW